jgi:hypothetical protein
MRPITLVSTLFVCLHLLPGTASADSGGGGWSWPVRGDVITGYRNGSDPYAAGQHRGVDIASPAGTRVVAATGGTVTFVGVVGSSGLTIAERTADGRFDLSYLHLGSAVVHRGDFVAAGDGLGTVGTSGHRSADAPHLHFGVREAGSHTAYRDPLDFLAPPPAGDAPGPAPSPVLVAHPASPHPAPTAAPEPSAPALPALPAPVPAPSGIPALSAPVQPAAGHSSVLPSRTAGVAAPGAAPLAGAALPPLLDPGSAHAGGRAPFPQLLDGHASAASAAGANRTTGNDGHGSAPDARVTAPRALRGSATSDAPTNSATSPGTAPGEREHGHPATTGSRHGIDVGWLAACLGLIAAATALGHPDGTRKLTARGRARIGAVLRPASRGG